MIHNYGYSRVEHRMGLVLVPLNHAIRIIYLKYKYTIRLFSLFMF